MKIIKLIVLFCLIIAVAIITMFIFGQEIGYQLVRGESSDFQTLVLVSGSREIKQPAVIIIQAGDELNKSKVVASDGGLQVDLIGGYGQYQLGSVWPLLDLDGKDQNFQRAVFSFIINQPVKAVLPLPKLSTENLSKWSLIGQLFKITGSSFLDSEKRSVLVQAILILRHQQRISVTHFQDPHELISELKTDQSVLKDASDQCSIAVMNASNASGLANQYRQLIESNGGYVVRVDDAPHLLEKTVVVIDQKKGEQCDLTARLITQLFPFSLGVVKATDVYTTYRTPMAILLGEDMAKIRK